MNGRNALYLLAACLAMSACSSAPRPAAGPIKAEVVRTDAGYVLMRGGEPYAIRGAGMAVEDIARFTARGGNSIRNWTTDSRVQDLGKLLDTAHAHGVTVAVGLPMKPERHGFDYDDPAAVAAQRESFRDDILRYRDHPALLAWIVGNELNHSYTNPRVFDAVEDVTRMIKELDPNHPVTTALAGFYPEVVAEAQARAPSLDFLSFQNYGSLFGLTAKMAAAGFTWLASDEVILARSLGRSLDRDAGNLLTLPMVFSDPAFVPDVLTGGRLYFQPFDDGEKHDVKSIKDLAFGVSLLADFGASSS